MIAGLAAGPFVRRAEPDQSIGSFLLTEAFFWQAVNNQDLPELTDRFRDESQRVQELCEKQLKKDNTIRPRSSFRAESAAEKRSSTASPGIASNRSTPQSRPGNTSSS